LVLSAIVRIAPSGVLVDDSPDFLETQENHTDGMDLRKILHSQANSASKPRKSFFYRGKKLEQFLCISDGNKSIQLWIWQTVY
jgi:hypothetical protein